MARRATSLKAMFCAHRLGAVATATQWRTRSGWRSVQASACMPPRLPPSTAASCAMPRRSIRRTCASTQSSTVTTGKSAPQTRPVAGFTCIGPVQPKHEPGLLTPMTKKRSVSSGLPGPTRLSHQPVAPWSSTPATWWLAFSAWHTSTALLLSALSVP